MSGVNSNLPRRIWRNLNRLDLVSILIFLVLLVTLLGSLFPQRSTYFDKEGERLSLWEAAVAERYGRWASLLEAIGIFQIYRSPIFILFVALLALSTLVCTLDRWRPVWRRTFRADVTSADATFETSPHTRSIAAVEGSYSSSSIRETLEHLGYRVRAQSAEGVDYLRGDRNRYSPLASLISHLAIILLLVGAWLSVVFSWREEMILGPKHPTSLEHCPEITVEYKGFTVERYPDRTAANYEVEIMLHDEDGESFQGSIRVNEPLKKDGVSYYLMGFMPLGDDYFVSLLASHDIGYGPVLLSGFLFLLGLTVHFNFPHSCIHVRYAPRGDLQLAGRSDRRAYDFPLEFNSLVKEIKAKFLSGGGR